MGFFSRRGNEVKVPIEVRADPNTYECARVWMRQGDPVVFVERIRETEDPRAWGSVLADVAAVVSGNYRDASGRPAPGALAEIQKMFNHLVDHWVDQRSGDADAQDREDVRRQGLALWGCSAFAFIMAEGSPDPDQRSAWESIRNMTGTYGNLHMRAVMSSEDANVAFGASIQSALTEFRSVFREKGAQAVAHNVGLCLAWAMKAPKDLDRYDGGDSSTDLYRTLLRDFAPSSESESRQAASQVGELVDVVNEAFSR